MRITKTLTIFIFLFIVNSAIAQITTRTSLSSTTYQYTGSTQSWTVPAGVTEITVKTWGAGGAGRTGSYNFKTGGSGGYAEATLTVTPGSNLIIVVGGGGQYAASDGGLGGWPGGGYGTAG